MCFITLSEKKNNSGSYHTHTRRSLLMCLSDVHSAHVPHNEIFCFFCAFRTVLLGNITFGISSSVYDTNLCTALWTKLRGWVNLGRKFQLEMNNKWKYTHLRKCGKFHLFRNCNHVFLLAVLNTSQRWTFRWFSYLWYAAAMLSSRDSITFS